MPVYDTADYSLPSYQSRMDDVCCLEYSLPYLPRSGFALFSLATRGKADLVHAIVSYQVLNAATPVIVAIVGFGWVIYALECRFNDEQFTTPSAGICAFKIRQYRGLDFNSLRLTLAPSPPTVARSQRRLFLCGHGNVWIRRCVKKRRSLASLTNDSLVSLQISHPKQSLGGSSPFFSRSAPFCRCRPSPQWSLRS